VTVGPKLQLQQERIYPPLKKERLSSCLKTVDGRSVFIVEKRETAREEKEKKFRDQSCEVHKTRRGEKKPMLA